MRSQFAQNADGSVLRDPISGGPIPVRREVRLNRQSYNARSLKNWMQHQEDEGENALVPHTRRAMTTNQERAVDAASDRNRHPLHVFRDREVIAGALNRTEVSDLMYHVCSMTDLISVLKRGRHANQTIGSAVGYGRLDADPYIAGIGYRLQIEKTSLLNGGLRILPVHSYRELAQLPVESFRENDDYEHEFYLVPTYMEGYSKNAIGDVRQGVIVLSTTF